MGDRDGRPSWSFRVNIFPVLDQPSLENDVVNAPKPWLDVCDEEDKQADDNMAVRPYTAIFRGADGKPDAESGRGYCHGIHEDLADDVYSEEVGARDVQANEDCAKGCEKCPCQGSEHCVDDKDAR